MKILDTLSYRGFQIQIVDELPMDTEAVQFVITKMKVGFKVVVMNRTTILESVQVPSWAEALEVMASYKLVEI